MMQFDDNEWEEYEGKAQLFAKRSKPALTIQKSGRIGINQQAYEALGEPPKVVFQWNPKRKQIALKAATESAKNAYPLYKQRSMSYLLSAQSFLDYIGYETGGKAETFFPELVNGMLILEVGDKIVEASDDDGKN